MVTNSLISLPATTANLLAQPPHVPAHPPCPAQPSDSGSVASGSPTAAASSGGPAAAGRAADSTADAAEIGERFRALTFGERVSLCTAIFKTTEPARAALRPVGRHFDSFALETE